MADAKNKKKIVIWTIIGVVLLALITFGLYYVFVVMKKEEKPTSTGRTDPIAFKTTEQSVARAIQFDVGQADCGLVQVSKDDKFETTNDNFNILVDIGVENGSSNDTKKQLCDKIYDKFVRNVDLIVFSHMHFDHIGAASYFLKDNRFTFKNTTALFNWAELRFTANSSKGLTATTKTLMKDLENKKIELADSDYWARLESPSNRIVDFGNNNYFSVLGGIDVQIKNNPNAWSVVNRMQWTKKSILYTGDLAGELSKQGIAIDIPDIHYPELDCDILKAPHHGSATEKSNGLDFIKAVSPEQVWVSVGHSDSYTLPDTGALKNYIAGGVAPENIWGTEQFGIFPKRTQQQIEAELLKNYTEQNNNKKPADRKPQSEIDKKAKDDAAKIFNGWAPLYEWLEKYPTANNSNKGYGDIKYDFNTTSFTRQPGQR